MFIKTKIKNSVLEVTAGICIWEDYQQLLNTMAPFGRLDHSAFTSLVFLTLQTIRTTFRFASLKCYWMYFEDYSVIFFKNKINQKCSFTCLFSTDMSHRNC